MVVHSISAHHFVTSLIWELHVGRDRALGGNMPQAFDMAIGGWQVAGNPQVGSGVPISVRAPNTLGAFD